MVNMCFDFELIGKQVKVIVERLEEVTRILITDGKDPANKEVKGSSEFFEQIQGLFDACGAEEVDANSIISDIKKFLESLGLSSVDVSLDKIYILISKQTGQPVTVNYAIRITVDFEYVDTQSGFMKFFKLDQITLNVWNIPSYHPVYKNWELSSINVAPENSVNTLLCEGSEASVFENSILL